MNILRFFLLPLLLAGGVVSAQRGLTPADLTVLPEPASTMMQRHLTGIVDEQFAARAATLAQLRTAADWQRRAQEIREAMAEWTGPFPERNPLNARISGTLDREDYVVEKLLFESRPGYLVSANLYRPKGGTSRRPAHINVIGHAQIGKADERYQRMSIAQARNGFVVLTIDGMGQGERGELSAHQIIGRQAFLSGTHVFNFMVWDVIRAIDYLVSRPDVDPSRIGITGSSGGGMMSTYLLPFEDRVAISVPTCNPNTWSHRVHAGLATDHEQVFFGAFARGIDPRGDPLFAHVPKPLLLNATTDDNLNPPRGVWELGTWLRKAYGAHDVPEKFGVSMVKAGHAYNQEQREITYAWMLRWTGGRPSIAPERDAPLAKAEDLWAAVGGSVFNEPGARRPQELVLAYLEAHRAVWDPVRGFREAETHRRKLVPLVREILHTDLGDVAAKGEVSSARLVGAMRIRSFVLEPEDGIVIPGVVLELVGMATGGDLILYVNEGGKSAFLPDIELVTALLAQGRRICAVDLRGTGETAPDLANKFWDFLAGRPIFGQRVREVMAVARWLRESELRPARIHFWGTGMGALYGAFAGVLGADFAGYVLEEPLLSFESVVRVETPKYGNEILLPGILEKFDLPQIYQALSPRPVAVLNPRRGDKAPATAADLETIDRLLKVTYAGNALDWIIGPAGQSERSEIIRTRFGR